ncbi:MAG: ABC transporter substrate-binding protein [Limnochordia bacterium]
MKKASILVVAVVLLTLSQAVWAEANPFEVTEPITITWWHAHEEVTMPYLNYVLERFHEEHPLITVDPVYIGSYNEINTQLIAAIAAEEVPAVVILEPSQPPYYGANGLAEVLDPYIEAYGYDVYDFVEGLVVSTSYNGQQVSLPYLISTQVMYYNKDVVEAEGLTVPKTFDQMEEFLEKATLFNEDGTTKRYGTVFAGWNYWYFETLYKNHGVQVILEDGLSTDINSETSVYITNKIKEWIDKGYAYFAYGTGASGNMRQTFWDGNAVSVFHTSALYDAYREYSDFEVGVAWMPGSSDGTSFMSELGGAVILIPKAASQRQKNAAWQFMMFVTSPEMNLYWASKTGYLPTRQSVTETAAYGEYLKDKPDMAGIIEMGPWIRPLNPHPAYHTIAREWVHALARIFNEGAPVQQTLDDLAELIEEILADY